MKQYIYTQGHAPLDPSRSECAERGGSRRLAPVRFSRIQPHRAPVDRPRWRGQNDHAALVLRHPRTGRTEEARPRNRAIQPRPPARQQDDLLAAAVARERPASGRDRKSTRLNSSHVAISYAVFCLKKKKKIKYTQRESE